MRLGIVQHSLGTGRDPLAAIDRARALQIDTLGLGLGPAQDDPALLAAIGKTAEAARLSLETSWGDAFIANGAEQRTESLVSFIRTCCKPLGITVIGTASGSDRWRREPPLAEQLDRMVAALTPLAQAAASEGVVLALENHADYRGHEVAAIIRRVNSPGLGARLDTGNAYAVIEEPEEATAALASYTVATHIKDLFVRPKHQGLLSLVGCGTGEGDVNVAACVELLAAQAPNPTNLVLCLEIEPPRGTDLWPLAQQSVVWMREHLHAYLQ
ncbi:MAG: sugar phosphate isomerase/epimerase [Chloroflexi bacterium]|nr:sugar phosphate isomerase/epimerase [Chloroflexota bacterium]